MLFLCYVCNVLGCFLYVCVFLSLLLFYARVLLFVWFVFVLFFLLLYCVVCVVFVWKLVFAVRSIAASYVVCVLMYMSVCCAC